MTTTAPKLEFALQPFDDGERKTTCKLAIAIDGETVWPVRGEEKIALEIQIEDLLSHLTEFWKPLMLRQVYPIAVTPIRPSDLRRLAEQRWANSQPATVEKEEELVSAFEEAHDLAAAFGGLFDLPHFWIVRSGDRMILESAGRVWHLPYAEVRISLQSIGDKIGQALAAADMGQWKEAIDAWNNRDASDSAGLLAWSAGIDKNLASALIADGNLRAPRDFDDAANDNDELRIAARMAGALPPEQIRTILATARQFERLNSEKFKLEKLAEECLSYIDTNFARKHPYGQGEAAALFVRDKLGVANDGYADIFTIAQSLGIAVRNKKMEPATFDGLAIWGSQYGPGVFLNEGSFRIRRTFLWKIERDASARVTLAHELCHLLLDGGHALSAVEVLNARMPTGVEARAKSFAGEFLLPTQAAARVWDRARRPTDRTALEDVVRELHGSFGVTKSVAAWKLQHGAESYHVYLEKVLDQVVPHR